MRLELKDEQIKLLKEMISGMKNVANETEDDVQLQYCIQVERKLNRITYTEFKNHQIEYLWYMADSGTMLAIKAEEDAQSEETKEKARLVQQAYNQIKTDIEQTIIKNSPKKA
jgi:hypothetical protein